MTALRSAADDASLAGRLAAQLADVEKTLNTHIVGQRAVVEQLLVTLLAGGHGLLVGVPGLAKTLLVRTLGACLSLSHHRIQFTPDLMPADITGSELLVPQPDGSQKLRFEPGPLFAHLVLADEINRTPPKTQAALLECMQEGRVTSYGVEHRLPQPFHVFATQNPLEQEGTYALPEAQLDRFMLAIEVDYPAHADEVAILKQHLTGPLAPPQPLLGGEELLAFAQLVGRVPVSDEHLEFIARLTRLTRPHEADAAPEIKRCLKLGAGPRAAAHLVRAAQARALLRGRFALAQEDIVALAAPALAHRLVRNFIGEAEQKDTRELVHEALGRM